MGMYATLTQSLYRSHYYKHVSDIDIASVLALFFSFVVNDLLQQSAFYQQLGANIRKYRKRLRLSQDALARLIGLTRTSLTNIENGRQHPPLHTFCDILEQLKIDVWELLPRKIAPIEPEDMKDIVSRQARGDSERAFIEAGIGLQGGQSHGNTKKKNPGNDRRASN